LPETGINSKIKTNQRQRKNRQAATGKFTDDNIVGKTHAAITALFISF